MGINAGGQTAVVSFGQTPDDEIASYVRQNNSVKRVPLESVFDINFRGWVTGYHFGKAGIYKGSGSVKTIDTGAGEAAGVSINNRGNVLIQAFGPDRSYLYKGGNLINLRSKGMTRVGTVNDLDQVAGACQGGVACIYDNGSVRRLAPQKLRNGFAVHVNGAGQVIGTYSFAPFDEHGFLYHNGTVTDLGTMLPEDISSAGTIVGTARFGSNLSAALRVGGKTYDLNKLTNDLGGFTLERANSLNGRGDIVGQGTNSLRETRGFLLRPITAATDTPAD